MDQGEQMTPYQKVSRKRNGWARVIFLRSNDVCPPNDAQVTSYEREEVFARLLDEDGDSVHLAVERRLLGNHDGQEIGGTSIKVPKNLIIDMKCW